METKRELKNFINPKTIALIGASNNLQKVGGILMEKLLKFKGKIIPINIHESYVQRKKAYQSILKIKDKIDLTIIATPSKTVIPLIQQCIQKKIKNIIIISAGFSEIGNKKQEEEISQLAKKHSLNILGPNCFGIANPSINLDTTFSNISSKKGDTAFISQSGALFSYIADYNIGISKFISLGNISDLNFSDLIEYLNKDNNTKKIILYVEKLKQGKKFIKICKKSNKKITIVKTGETKISSNAALSHTGSLATDFEIYKGAFKQAKIKQINSLAKAFNIQQPKIPLKLKNKKTIIITNAGGAGALLSDELTKKRIKIIQKPIDLLGTAQPLDYKKSLEKIKKNIDFITIILTPQKMTQPLEVANTLIEFNKKNKKKIIAFFLGDKSIKEATHLLKKNNIKVFNSI